MADHVPACVLFKQVLQGAIGAQKAKCYNKRTDKVNL